jgi:hypothetical protein
MGEAKGFELVKSQAVRYGLCVACASQLAWGHQNGFGALTTAPCPRCAPLVAALPNDKPGAWRTVHGTASAGRSWPS